MPDSCQVTPTRREGECRRSRLRPAHGPLPSALRLLAVVAASIGLVSTPPAAVAGKVSPDGRLGAEELAERREELDPMAQELGVRERLGVLVERVKLEQNQIETMAARFRQDKTSAMLLEPSIDTGVFYYDAPDRVRWEYQEPEEMLVVINGEELTTWYQEQGLAEKASVGEISEQVFKYLGASGSLEKLTEFFEVTAFFPEENGDPYHLVLDPRYSRIERRLEGMEIWIDPESFQPTRFKYLQPGGDETSYRFEDIVLNQELDDELFVIELPDDVQVREIDLGSRSR